MKREDLNDLKTSPGEGLPGGETRDRERKPDRPVTATMLVRATVATIVFGIPLVVGTATVAGYGLWSLYKRLTDR
jgi:hypothetical protein